VKKKRKKNQLMRKQQKGRKQEKGKRMKNKEPEEDEGEGEKDDGPNLDDSITRWVIQPDEAKTLYLKFFSTKVGKYNQTLNFEVCGSYKQFPLGIKAICEFPTINPNPKNVFYDTKRNRPPNPPESYLQKCYVTNESLFDFGPLLIGKDPEKRGEDEELKKANSAEFRITNNGKYDLNVKFALESTLAGEETEKSPFIYEPETMDLKIEDTENLRVW
jgi:hydrocephalus-inducing protein